MKIRVASAINAKYFNPLLVMLESLRDHLRKGVDVEFYLVHRGLPPEMLARIESVFPLVSLQPAPEMLAGLPTTASFPAEASFPVILPQLTDCDRMLFVDADILVLDDITKLWETDLQGKTVAAAPDAAVQTCDSPRGVKQWRKLGIPAGSPYMNCGVMLIDMVQWRRSGVTGRVIEYLKQSDAPNDFLHQEPINGVLWQDWLRLSSRWNLIGGLAGRPFGSFEREAWREPGMVHFAGRLKPWLMPVGSPFAETYLKYLRKVTGAELPQPTGWRMQFDSFYDRHLRNFLYPVEQAMWRRRWI